MLVSHEFGPFYDEDSKILILGSFPSVKSRELQFYYGHAQNRFWKVLAACFDELVPNSVEEKKNFLKANHIALWDVIESCEIIGSSDASIKNAKPTDLEILIDQAKIELILVNGKTAMKYFKKFHNHISIPVYCMPSTSPANAAKSLNDLIEEWKIVKSI